MYGHFNIALLIFGFAAFTACDKVDDACKQEKNASAIIGDFPDSLAVGVVHQQRVQYVVENSCGEFVAFDTEKTGSTIEVKVKMVYEGCTCAMEFKEEERYLPVMQETPGMYHYRFWVSDTQYESFTLTVYE